MTGVLINRNNSCIWILLVTVDDDWVNRLIETIVVFESQKNCSGFELVQD